MIFFVLLLIYFIKKQFQFERPTRFMYVIIPVITLVLFMFNFELNFNNVFSVVIIIVLGILTGMLQGRYAQIREYSDAQLETKVEIKGGWVYLVGWVFILIIQVVIGIVFNNEHLEISKIVETASNIILEEILPYRKISGDTWWPLWALSLSSSLAYSFVLSRRSVFFKNTLRHGSRKSKRIKKTN